MPRTYIRHVLDTPVQGWEKRQLNDLWVPAQLWVVTPVGNSSVYALQNATGRTFLDVKAGGFAFFDSISRRG